MYTFTDTELAEMIDQWSRDRSNILWFWYRDVILQAQERGLIKIIAHTEENPFWWRLFADSIELADRAKEIIARNRQRDNKGVNK